VLSVGVRLAAVFSNGGDAQTFQELIRALTKEAGLPWGNRASSASIRILAFLL
jgi:hypothetical protein